MACCLIAITWTNIDLLSKVIWGIRLRAILQEILMYLIQNMCSEITLFKLVIVLLKHGPLLHNTNNICI